MKKKNKTDKKLLKNSISKKLNISIIFAFLTLLSITGCSLNTEEPISKTELLMDTVVTITLYDIEDKNNLMEDSSVTENNTLEEILENAFDYCADLEVQFSNTKENGEICHINDRIGEQVLVSESTIELLTIGKKYEELSHGLFVMEIGSLSTLWDFHEESQYFPSEEEIAAAKEAVNTDALTIHSDSVCLWKTDLQEQPQLDLGAIAKGYIADCLKNYLTEQGVTSAIINLGGNVLTIGNKPNGEAFAIGIQQPFSTENETAIGIKVEDSSVVTSGVYQRYFERDGKLYHHILDPNTGYPAETDLYSVTILSEKSVDGDALSTICVLLGKEEGMAFIEKMDGVEGIFITEENEIYCTSGITEEILIR